MRVRELDLGEAFKEGRVHRAGRAQPIDIGAWTVLESIRTHLAQHLRRLLRLKVAADAVLLGWMWRNDDARELPPKVCNRVNQVRAENDVLVSSIGAQKGLTRVPVQRLDRRVDVLRLRVLAKNEEHVETFAVVEREFRSGQDLDALLSRKVADGTNHSSRTPL
jgi:hypothetical protein